MKLGCNEVHAIATVDRDSGDTDVASVKFGAEHHAYEVRESLYKKYVHMRKLEQMEKDTETHGDEIWQRSETTRYPQLEGGPSTLLSK